MSFMESLRWKPKGETKEERVLREDYSQKLANEEKEKQNILNSQGAIDILKIKVDDDGNYYLYDDKTNKKSVIPDLGTDPTSGKRIVRDIRTPMKNRYLPVIDATVKDSTGQDKYRSGMYGRQTTRYGVMTYDIDAIKEALHNLQEIIREERNKKNSEESSEWLRQNLAKAPNSLRGYRNNFVKGVRGIFSRRNTAPAAGGRRTRKHRSTKRRSRKNRR